MCFPNDSFDTFDFHSRFTAIERQLVMVGPPPPAPEWDGQDVNSLELDNEPLKLRMDYRYVVQKAAIGSAGDNSSLRTMCTSKELLSPASSHETTSSHSLNSLQFQQPFSSPEYSHSPERSSQYSLSSDTNYLLDKASQPVPLSYNSSPLCQLSICLPEYDQQPQQERPPMKLPQNQQLHVDQSFTMPTGTNLYELPASDPFAIMGRQQQQAYQFQYHSGAYNAPTLGCIITTGTNKTTSASKASAQYPSPVTPSNDTNFQQINPEKPPVTTAIVQHEDIIPVQARAPPKQASPKQETSIDLRPRCQLCNREYRHPKHLARHLKTHTGIRPFSCSICDATFVRSDIRNRHYQRCLSNNSGSKSSTATRHRPTMKLKDQRSKKDNSREKKPGDTNQASVNVSSLYSYGQLFELSNSGVSASK
ncbi:hypothetical protein TRVA0_006S04104 [Trichomonascus vanleenenianus]|uniref:C2H2-type zinc finger protein n=1 Tax=Trichomonascus vanleenenianus TaxID=2268995 RepID=UPI003ECA985E